MTVKKNKLWWLAVGVGSWLALPGGCTGTMDLGYNVAPDGGSAGGGGQGGRGGAGGAGGAGGTGGTVLCEPATKAVCYDGPTGTENKGNCHSGLKTCTGDGSGYGPCEGESTPQMENCANPEDEDCDGLSPPCKGNLGWAKHFGDMQGQQGRGIAVDSAGASFITGTFYGTTDFGGGVLSSAGYMDGFLLKLDPAGNHIWSRRLTGPGDQIATSVATDGSGAVFVAGTFSGTIDLGNGPMASGGGIDIFVARFDVNGSCLWSKRFGDAADQLIDGVAVDPTSNDVIIAGHFYGKVDFGGGPLANVGGANVFVAKLDMNGGHVWSRSSHGSGDQLAGGVAVDGMGNVLTTGTFYGSVDFGGGLLVSQGGADVFVVKTSAGGDHLWSKRFGDAGDQAGTSIAPDSAAGIVVTGYFDGSINFGASTLTSGGSTDIFVTKLDKDGGHLWSKRFGDAGSQPDSVVAVDKMDNVVITGAFASAVNFGDGPHASAGSYDIFLAKLDAAGNNVWGKSFGDKLAQGAYGIAVDGGENILITGSMAGKVDFGDGAPVASAGGDDVFVAKFGP